MTETERLILENQHAILLALGALANGAGYGNTADRIIEQMLRTERALARAGQSTRSSRLS